MSISSLGSLSSGGALQQLEALYKKMEAKLETSTTSTTSTTNSAAGDSDSISGIGKILGNLQELATTDPEKFKKDTASIAAALTEAANKTTGDESTFLKDLASQFQKASDTGDASALAPRHHGHHDHSSGSSSSSSAASQYGGASLFSMLNVDSTATTDYLSGSQQTLLNSLLGGSNG